MILPQCEIKGTRNQELGTRVDEAQEVLFVTGGRMPSVEWFRKAADGRKVFCVDKGIELCRECEIVPSFLIGDFDSANQSAVEWARANNVPVEQYPADKDLTDTQLALSRAVEIFGEHVALVTGCFGGRFDHLYSTAFSCAAARQKIILADEREIISYVKGGEAVEVKFSREPLAVSLLPITANCAGVTIKNVRWELDGATLTQALPYAVSNRVSGDRISIGVRGGTLAVYLYFEQ